MNDAFSGATPITVGTEYYSFIDSAATGPYGPGSAGRPSINAVWQGLYD